MLKDWIERTRQGITAKAPDFSKIKTGVNETERKRRGDAGGKGKRGYTNLPVPEVPDGCYRKCNFCGKTILAADVRSNFYCCPKCGEQFSFPARRRIEMIADADSFEEMDAVMPFVNPLDFPGYEAKVEAQQRKTGLDEAVVTGYGRIDGMRAVLAVCDGRFIMSSMGHNVGEKLTRAIETATRERLPLIIYCCSGGARMQEGIVSLMQMAKTAAALKRHRDQGLLYISLLTNPTTGGVTASFAMLGDIILAEPKALIGFAGPRVIEQTIRQKLPEGFQRAEFLLEHGFVDRIAERPVQKKLLAELLRMHDMRAGRRAFDRYVKETGVNDAPFETDSAPSEAAAEETAAADESRETVQEKRAARLSENRDGIAHAAGQNTAGAAAAGTAQQAADDEDAEKKQSAWDIVQRSRAAGRPKASEYIELLFEDFTELHGDRLFGDDGAIVGGLAKFHGLPVTVIAEQKGHNTADNIKRNFGMPSPEGYRKAQRLMREADVFRRPIICFVDTPGAYPGMSSEERGQGEAIAQCLYLLSGVRVPVLSIVLSEGGSGGALALAVANEVWMLENATYSILSPEGFASILYKDASKARDAAKVMKITARDLEKLHVIDRIIREPEPVSAENLQQIAGEIDRALAAFLSRTLPLSGEALSAGRYDRFRAF